MSKENILLYHHLLSHGTRINQSYKALTLLEVAMSTYWAREHVLDMPWGVSLKLDYVFEGGNAGDTART